MKLQFDIDEKNLNILRKLTTNENNLGEFISKSLRLMSVIEKMKEKGFTQVLIYNPNNQETQIVEYE